MSKVSLRGLLSNAKGCVLMFCVYDAASERVVEMVGFAFAR